MTMSDCSVVVTLTVLLAIQPVCCTQNIYFVKPTPDTPCPSEPCLTLSEYAQGTGPLFTPNATMVFLPGDHQLYNDMGITNITTFTMVGGSTSLPDITSNIVCTDPAAFIFQNISYLKIQALELSYCGSATLAAMSLISIPQFELSNSAFRNSRYISLEATGSDLTITETIFHGSSSTGLMLWGCTAEFHGNNVFSNNLRSGVLSYKSILYFSGASTFVNNLGKYCGGGISAVNSIIYSSGQCTTFTKDAESGKGIVRCDGEISFVQNSVEYGGGICALRRSDLRLSGNLTFTNNFATHHGGGIYIQDSMFSCEGLTSFVNNSARIGGGVSVNGSQIMFSENTTFTSNTAQNGGGAFVSLGNVHVKGYTSFVNNLASRGGALTAEDSTVTCEGLYFFINNSATNTGGGIQMWNSTLSCEGLTSFVSNSAEYGGGIACANSQITFTNFASQNITQHGGGDIRVNNDSVKDGNVLYFNTCVNFSNNLAEYGGGLLCLSNNTVEISNCKSTFSHNSARLGGGIIVIKGTTLTVRGISIFTNNSAIYSGGAVHIYGASHMTLYGSTRLVQNTARNGGGIYLYNGNLTMAGNTYLYGNSATNGGGVHGTMATITINGYTNISDNSALLNGGGLFFSSSQCFLTANGTMYLVNNHAEQYGGAIYNTDDTFVYCSFFENPNIWGQCFFQPEGVSENRDTSFMGWDENASSICCITANNTAGKAGGVLYGGMIDRCRLIPATHHPGQVFDEIFDITEHSSGISIIASSPFLVCLCFNHQPDCTKYGISVTVYPGEPFSVPVVAVGQRYGSVPAVVKSSLEDKQSMLDSLQEAQSVNNTCTALQYTIYSNSNKATMTIEVEGPCLELVQLQIINITFLQCPTGFMLSNSTKGCTCEKRLQKYTNRCNITSRKIDRDSEFWVGVDSGLGGTVLHPHCPFDYCKSHPVSFTLNETDLECSYDRTGLLCGGCQPGLSNVLGSSRCIKCSGAYLSLLIPFALAGIVLVAFLLLCKLTVTVGSINGLIFYANIIAVNRSVFLPSGQENVLTIFIAWLNLDLGIETCFYDGVDTYARTWLQFAFPLYVWVIVGTIVILSHYYGAVARMFGRNPIAVLATLFLLSYAKLLRTIIAVLSFTYLEYPDGAEVAVWLYDGNIRYLKGKHIPLFLTALLVLLLLFLPYTLLLLLGQWIQAQSEKRIFSWISNYRVKPFLDAYHAPYRDEYRYWPGLLLVLRCVLFLVFAFNVLGNPSVNLLAISVCTLVIVVILTQLTGKVYVNHYINAIDVSYLLNIGVLASATLYVRSVGGRQDILAYTSLSIAFTTFLGILIYHVLTQIRVSRVWRETIWPTLERMRQRTSTSLHRDLSDTDTQREEPAIVGARAPTTTYVNLRELLLEDNS